MSDIELTSQEMVDWANANMERVDELEAEIERLTFVEKNHLQGIAMLEARVEELEGVYLMARRYLFDPNWDTHRQNLVNALKKAATEQEGE